jgi:hypothetical protein
MAEPVSPEEGPNDMVNVLAFVEYGMSCVLVLMYDIGKKITSRVVRASSTAPHESGYD